MMPLTTMGVASDPPPPNRGGAASPFNENAHADFSEATFLTLICVSGEYRVLAMSWLYEGQSPGAVLACWAFALAAKQTSHAVRIVFGESCPIR